MTNSWTDIKNTDLVVIMGGNAAEAHPCGFKWVTEAKANRGAKLIVVDPRYTRSASVSDFYAPIRQGTDIAFLLGVINYCMQNDKVQWDYVKAFTNAPYVIKDGFDYQDGLFTGYDETRRDYNRSTWDYDIGADGYVVADDTLQLPIYAMAADVRSLATEVTTDSFRGVTALTVVAPDHPRLLSGIAGACAAAGANIVDAQIFTTTDGLAVDTIFVSRAFERDEDELRRGQRIATNIERTLRGEVRLAEIAPQREVRDVRRGAFAIEPEVTIDNTLSRRYTVVEVSGLDRPGLLRDLTSSLSRLNLNIGSAHIVTFGEKAVDAFYVTDLTGQKINSAAKQAAIKRRLLADFALDR